jgi:hypothetical protein
MAGCLAFLGAAAFAVAEKPDGQPAAAEAPSPWAFAVTAYPTVVRGGQNYTSGIATADRGPLHLEGRVNYESIGARSGRCPPSDRCPPAQHLPLQVCRANLRHKDSSTS